MCKCNACVGIGDDVHCLLYLVSYCKQNTHEYDNRARFFSRIEGGAAMNQCRKPTSFHQHIHTNDDNGRQRTAIDFDALRTAIHNSLISGEILTRDTHTHICPWDSRTAYAKKRKTAHFRSDKNYKCVCIVHSVFYFVSQYHLIGYSPYTYHTKCSCQRQLRMSSLIHI